MGIIIRLVVTAIVAFFLTKVLAGVHIASFGAALVFAIVLGVLNLILRPILQLLGLPLTIITFGLFSLVINAIVVILAANFVPGMQIDGFLWALLFSVVLTFLTSIVNGAIAPEKK